MGPYFTDYRHTDQSSVHPSIRLRLSEEPTPRGWGVLGRARGLCHPVLGRTVRGEVRVCGSVWERASCPAWGALEWCTGPFLWGQPGDGQAIAEPGLSFRAFPWHL